jgi:carbamoyltransferase
MSAADKIVLGVNLSHDTACAAVVNGEVKVAIAEERLNRVKHCTGVTPFGRMIPYRSIRYCCEYLGVAPQDVDLFVVNSCRSNSLEHLRAQLLGIPAERATDLPHPGHHLAHAHSAFYCSEFDEAAVIVVDTNGSFMERPGQSPDALVLERKEHFTAFHGDRDGLRAVISDFVNPGEVSLGELYCIYSAALQLTPREGTYGYDDPLSAGGKLMGLASYDLGRTPAPGICTFRDDHLAIPLDRVIDRLEHLGFVERREPGLSGLFGFEMRTLVDLKRRQDELKNAPYLALAGEAQRELERALIDIARRVHALTKSKNLCLAGGTMLNVTACTRLLEETPFEKVFIQPAANDSGNAVGAALFGYRTVLGGRERPYLERPYDTCLGRTYSPEAVAKAIESRKHLGKFTATRLSSLGEKAAALVPRLLGDQISAIFEGRSEFGPRALGHRSFLASPRTAQMRERMNELKHREWYRPVAPAILEEDFTSFFDGPFSSVPYMTLAARCKDIIRERAPSVCHVDGTARPQTVTARSAPLLHHLLVTMKEKNELPVLINTSLNVDKEPIVETPDDAVLTFLGSELLGSMLIDDYFLEKST